MDNRPIGVFDSGLGGLTAVHELTCILPDEDIIYFGDTGRVPYGTRSRETVLKYARQDIRFMQSFDIKAIVIACGTVSATALNEVAGSFDLPIVGAVRPAAYRAAQLSKNGRIGVIGTTATIRSGAYERLLAEFLPGASVTTKACPLLVPLVENGRFAPDDPVTRIVAGEYLAAFDGQDIDTLVLGCTHYPLLAPVFADILGPCVTLVNSGAEAAHDVRKLLLMTEKTAQRERTGQCRYFVSDSTDDFARYASMFLQHPVDGQVEYADIEAY